MWALSDLKIRTKDRRLVSLVPNAVQALYLDELLPGWRADPTGLRGKREILLKARQFGFSTLILALFFLDTLNTPQTQTVVVAHDLESAKRLFGIVQRFYYSLPADRRPRARLANQREFYWPELDSSFSLGTAGTGDFGRGGTLNNVHASEVAFWPDAEDQVAGLLQAVPADGNVFLETTANGMANWFYDEYSAAVRGDSVHTPRFYGWHQHAEYRTDGSALTRTAEEERLAAAHGLDDAQLRWRRAKVKELREKFPQEYPANPHEAFLTTGGRVLSEFVPERAPVGHLVPDFIPPREWRHYLVIDPGWKRTAALFAAVDPEGMLWLYAEYYQGERLPAEHLAALHAYWVAFGRPPYDVLMDPAGFTLKRTTTGHEHPSDADEYRLAASALGAAWFCVRPADNGDPLALRPKRYLATDMIRVGESLRWFRWEADRWVRQAPHRGRLAQERRDPERPIDRNNHLCDCFRYLCNELPLPLPATEAPVPVTREGRVREHLERMLARQGLQRLPGLGSEV